MCQTTQSHERREGNVSAPNKKTRRDMEAAFATDGANWPGGTFSSMGNLLSLRRKGDWQSWISFPSPPILSKLFYKNMLRLSSVGVNRNFSPTPLFAWVEILFE